MKVSCELSEAVLYSYIISVIIGISVPLCFGFTAIFRKSRMLGKPVLINLCSGTACSPGSSEESSAGLSGCSAVSK